MKRILCVLLLILLLSGCSQPQEEPPKQTEAVDFYYSGVLGEFSSAAVLPESRNLETTKLTLEELIDLYLKGPVSEGLRSPFPAGTVLEDLYMKDQVAYLTFNDAYAELTGIGLTLANACMVYTLTQFPDVDGVCLRTTGAMLTEQMSTVMTRSNFLLEDNTLEGDYQPLNLYFLTENGRWLTSESRLVSLDDPEETAVYLMHQLLLGPREETLQAILPEETELLDMELAGNVCTVDFSKVFFAERPADPATFRLMVLSVVNTLTQLPNVEYVRIHCEGQRMNDPLPMDLKRALRQDLSVVEDLRGANRMDVDLYAVPEGQQKLIPIPCKISLRENVLPEEVLLNKLLDLELVNGYENPVPSGTKVVSISTKDGLCRVELSNAFILCDKTPEQALLAVRTVAAALCGLEHVDQVLIFVQYGQLNQVDLSDPLMPSEDWFIS